jgi:hypothetical protein
MNRGVDESRMRGVDFPISLSAPLTLSLFRRESPRIRRLILVRSTTTSSVCLSSIAYTASSCLIDRNPISCVLKMRCITLQISLSRVVSTRTSLSLSRSAISKLLSPSRLFIVFGLSSTRSSYRLSLASSSTPKNLCHSMLSSRNASIDRTLRCLTISIGIA